MENHSYHIKWPPLNSTVFITHVRNLRNGCYANESYLNLWYTKIYFTIPLVYLYEARPKVIKRFYAQLKWAWNFKCS